MAKLDWGGIGLLRIISAIKLFNHLGFKDEIHDNSSIRNYLSHVSVTRYAKEFGEILVKGFFVMNPTY